MLFHNTFKSPLRIINTSVKKRSSDKIFFTPVNILQKQQKHESWNINIESLLCGRVVFTTWRSVSSCAGPGGLTGRKLCRTVCS